jgi:hypothetical protein
VTTDRCGRASDPEPDEGLALLTGPGAEDLLRAALIAGGDHLLSWRLRHVDHRPGRSTTVSYDAGVRTARGERRQVLGARTGLVPGEPLPGLQVITSGALRVAFWRWPVDPELPALRVATDRRCVRALLASLGRPDADPVLRVRGYRPGRRAVVEVRAADRRLFLKVLRPRSVVTALERHRLLHDAGLPVPRSLGWSDDGLLVLEGLPGTPLRSRLQAATAEVPDGVALLSLLDLLPDQVRQLPHRRSWTDEVEHYATVVASSLPSETERCRELARHIAAVTRDVPADQPGHGDFYEAQLLLDGPRVSGLLDVDTVGPGRRADDLACLLAHASVLALVRPSHRPRIETAAAAWLRDFDRVVDPADLRARVAGVVVSLATGPHRVQERDWPAATRARLDLAERWLGDAGRTAATA